MRADVTIVDYGMGNLRSLARALERAGAAPAISDDPAVITRAERVAIPGQGAFGQASARLRERGLDTALSEVIAAGRSVLGICLGLQLLFEGSAEAPGTPGLAVLPGAVALLPVGPGLKRPHMGWSPVVHRSDHPVLSANPSGEPFYFVHSFAAVPPGEASPCPRVHGAPVSIASADHGVTFVAALAAGRLVAAQFHPEKSQAAGAAFLAAWLAL